MKKKSIQVYTTEEGKKALNEIVKRRKKQNGTSERMSEILAEIIIEKNLNEKFIKEVNSFSDNHIIHDIKDNEINEFDLYKSSSIELSKNQIINEVDIFEYCKIVFENNIYHLTKESFHKLLKIYGE